MNRLDDWTRLFHPTAGGHPLSFVTGMRNLVPKNNRCEVHSHPDIEIVYHPLGSGTTCLDDDPQHRFEEGSVVVYAPHEKHNQIMTRNGEDLCVQISLPPARRTRIRKGFYIPLVRDPLIIEELRSLSRGKPQLSREEKIIHNLRSSALLLTLIQLASDNHRSTYGTIADRHVFRAEQYIRENCFQSVSTEEIARTAGIGPDHLRHLFKSLRGKSMVGYLREVRIDRAKTLLIHSQLSVKQIAAMCGFKNTYYFSTTFRQFTRTSPSRYRLDHTPAHTFQ